MSTVWTLEERAFWFAHYFDPYFLQRGERCRKCGSPRFSTTVFSSNAKVIVPDRWWYGETAVGAVVDGKAVFNGCARCMEITPAKGYEMKEETKWYMTQCRSVYVLHKGASPLEAAERRLESVMDEAVWEEGDEIFIHVSEWDPEEFKVSFKLQAQIEGTK